MEGQYVLLLSVPTQSWFPFSNLSMLQCYETYIQCLLPHKTQFKCEFKWRHFECSKVMSFTEFYLAILQLSLPQSNVMKLIHTALPEVYLNKMKLIHNTTKLR